MFADGAAAMHCIQYCKGLAESFAGGQGKTCSGQFEEYGNWSPGKRADLLHNTSMPDVHLTSLETLAQLTQKGQ